MSNRITVRNPRTGNIDYWINPPTPTQLSEICTKLRHAQPEWNQGGIDKRVETLQSWKQALIARKEAIVGALILDTGRKAESILEMDSLLSAIDRWCRLATDLLTPQDERTSAIPFITLQHQSVSYPLVGVISPWNFPLLLSTIDTIPALLAGCAVVVKPSEIAPRFIQPLVESITSVPSLQAVLAYIEGAGDTGASLIEQVDLVCFTGSIATGRKVAEVAARRFIPAFLELGGKDPAIVLKSANLGLATSAILWGSVVNAGQSCLSIERIYVDNAVFGDFVKLLVEKTQKLNINYPNIDEGQISPIISARQAEIITEHLQDAIEKGAKVHCGGKVEQLNGGYWCHPTVLTGVDHRMKIMTEETFAPIMPVMGFRNAEGAIVLANDSIYGLSGAVFAETTQEALQVAKQLQCGAISINDAALTALIHEAEKNAFKFSGLGGSRMGAASLQRFRRKQAFLIKTSSSADPWWFSV